MAISDDLDRQLHRLASYVDEEPEVLRDRLIELVESTRRLVPTLCGVQVQFVDAVAPLTLTELVGPGDLPAATSMSIPLAALATASDGDARPLAVHPTSGPDPFGTLASGWLVFGATTPDAFVDLATDLGRTLDLPVVRSETPRESWAAAIGLGGRAWSSDTMSGITGLAERSLVDQAVGALLARGMTVEEGRAFLVDGAAAAHLPGPAFAREWLDGSREVDSNSP